MKEKKQRYLSKNTSKIDLFLSRCFLFIISVLLALFIADKILGKFNPAQTEIQRLFSPASEWKKIQPYTMFSGHPGADFINEKLNIYGYRGKTPEPVKQTDEIRLFMLGGSTTVLGQPPASTYIEKKIQKISPFKINVFNYAVGASVSGMEMVRILTEISNFQPDIIIMYNGGNDILLPFLYDPRPGYSYDFIIHEKNPLLTANMKKIPAFYLLAYKSSNIFRKIFSKNYENVFFNLHELRDQSGYNTEKWREKIVEIYLNNLEKSYLMAQTFGSEFTAFFQPLAFFTKESIEPDFISQATCFEHTIKSRQLFREYLEDTPEPVKSSIIDLSDIFDSYGLDIYTDTSFDPIHTTQTAKPIIAQKICEHLIRKYHSILGIDVPNNSDSEKFFRELDSDMRATDMIGPFINIKDIHAPHLLFDNITTRIKNYAQISYNHPAIMDLAEPDIYKTLVIHLYDFDDRFYKFTVEYKANDKWNILIDCSDKETQGIVRIDLPETEIQSFRITGLYNSDETNNPKNKLIHLKEFQLEK